MTGRRRGNSHPRPDDLNGMTCERCREELSADLDGEADPACRDAVRHHLAGCGPCADWHETAATVTRLARTATAESGPDVVDRVLDALPAPTPVWRRVGPRVGLATVGLVQVGLALAALLGSAPPMGAEVMGAGMAHMSHESTAWNLALGLAFLVGAAWRRHLPGLLPALGSFIAVLAVLSVLDLAAGRVEPDRVASHLVLIVGFALSLMVARHRPTGGRGPERLLLTSPWSRRRADPPVPGSAPPATDPRGGGLHPVARRRVDDDVA